MADTTHWHVELNDPTRFRLTYNNQTGRLLG
jgi:hypothetical protein